MTISPIIKIERQQRGALGILQVIYYGFLYSHVQHFQI